MTPGESFGVRLRRLRLEAGMSQTQLAGRCGIPKSRLSRYENGHLLPSLTTLARLADGLGTTEGALLGEPREAFQVFVETLRVRGVDLTDVDRARELANAVADILEGLAETGSGSG